MSCTFAVYQKRGFHNELKLAKLLSIYKSDDKHQLKNYRPISVLPFIYKIFGIIVADSVIDFLDDHDDHDGRTITNNLDSESDTIQPMP